MPSTRRILSAIKRREAITGRRLTPAETRAIIEPAFTAEAGEATQRAALDVQAEFNRERIDIAKKEAAAAEDAATVSGIVDVGLLTLGTETGRELVGKGLQAGEVAPATDAGATIRESSAIETGVGAGVGAATGAAVESLSASIQAGGGASAAVGADASGVLVTDIAGNVAGESALAASSAEAATAESIAAEGLGVGGVFSSIAAGAAGGFVGQKLTKAGEPGHEGGEVLTGRAIGAVIGFAFGGPIGAGVGTVLGGGGTVICTELHKQGYMNDAMLELDGQFGAKIDAQVHSGYLLLASPIVNLMQKSKSFTWLVSKVTRPWVEQMAHEIRPEEYRSNIIGKLIMKVGFPLCRWKGEMKGKLTREVI